MKGFPAEVNGPLGPWYQKVNKAVAEARLATAAESVKSILGEPDIIVIVPEEDRISDESGEVDCRNPDTYYEYADPYRQGFFYRFGLVDGTVIDHGKCIRRS